MEESCVHDIPANQLDTRAVSYWKWKGFITCLFEFIIPLGYYAAYYFGGWPLWPFYILFILWAVWMLVRVFIIPAILWKTWRYDISEQEIDFLRGILIKKRTLIPMVRVQHVDTGQGPLMRRFGLAELSISTAAGSHEIPALAEETAHALRQRISVLARVVEEDV